MARSLIRVNLELDSIFVHDEGDGWGNAEPYLWTVFFKVDGHTVSVTDSLTLSGPPTIETTPGSHGNLGTTDADEGDTIIIPSGIGEWETILKPIPTPSSISSLVEDFGGMFGVVAVLMEEDNVSDDGAEAGHQALNQAVQDAIQQIINTRNITNQDVSEEEIAAFEDSIQSEVEDAIKDQQNFFENLWSWINPDDTIGTKVWTFKHDDLDPSTVINFSHRWKNEGDWEIFGHLSSSVLCPANSLSNFFSSIGSSGSSEKSAKSESSEMSSPFTAQTALLKVEKSHCENPPVDLEPLHKFRDGDYQKMPGLAKWFKLAERHTARLLYMLVTNKELRDSAYALLKWAPEMVQNLEAPVSNEHLDHAQRILVELTKQRSRNARIDASRTLDVLPLMRDKTTGEAMNILDQIQPARHPNTAGDPCLRVQSKLKKKLMKKEDGPKDKPACE